MTKLTPVKMGYRSEYRYKPPTDAWEDKDGNLYVMQEEGIDVPWGRLKELVEKYDQLVDPRIEMREDPYDDFCTAVVCGKRPATDEEAKIINARVAEEEKRQEKYKKEQVARAKKLLEEEGEL